MHSFRWSGLAVFLLLQVTPAVAGAQDDRQALLTLQAAQRTAHLEKDAELLASMIAGEFVFIGGGATERIDRDAFREQFESYFASVDFLEWADIAPPEITLSEDGTLATVVVTKRVQVRPSSQPDATVEESTFAWLEVWRKHDDRWLMEALASTSAP